MASYRIVPLYFISEQKYNVWLQMTEWMSEELEGERWCPFKSPGLFSFSVRSLFMSFFVALSLSFSFCVCPRAWHVCSGVHECADRPLELCKSLILE